MPSSSIFIKRTEKVCYCCCILFHSYLNHVLCSHTSQVTEECLWQDTSDLTKVLILHAIREQESSCCFRCSLVSCRLFECHTDKRVKSNVRGSSFYASNILIEHEGKRKQLAVFVVVLPRSCSSATRTR